jgi:hypothetical protein
MNHEVLIRQETMDLLMNIVGDNGENEDADQVINRIAKFYLSYKEGKNK